MTYSPRPTPLQASASPPLLCSTGDHITKLRKKKREKFSVSMISFWPIFINTVNLEIQDHSLQICSQCKILDGESLRYSVVLGDFLDHFSVEVFSAAKPGATLSGTVGTPLQQGCVGVATEGERNQHKSGERFSEKKYLFWKSLCTKIRKFSLHKDPLFPISACFQKGS